MYALPLAAKLAEDATAASARSGQPDAPVVPERGRYAAGPARQAAATALRRLADRLAVPAPAGRIRNVGAT
jgi:hypothetical protein